jgi:mRNA deadenylase 3'-5' endonuclease subunit Ccr4
MSYNILADQYAQEHMRELYSRVPRYALEWARRKCLIVREVEEWSPDIVCFQEVDHYTDLADALEQQGYAICSVPCIT